MATRGTSGQSRESRRQDFVDWSAARVTGDEKGQAQVFLDRLLQAFGQKGSLDVGGTAEMRIRKASEDGGGTSYADYVWKPVVLIEMKKRGADLSKHYRQAFDYWVRLVPDRPQYVVLCNFDERRGALTHRLPAAASPSGDLFGRIRTTAYDAESSIS